MLVYHRVCVCIYICIYWDIAINSESIYNLCANINQLTLWPSANLLHMDYIWYRCTIYNWCFPMIAPHPPRSHTSQRSSSNKASPGAFGKYPPNFLRYALENITMFYHFLMVNHHKASEVIKHHKSSTYSLCSIALWNYQRVQPNLCCLSL